MRRDAGCGRSRRGRDRASLIEVRLRYLVRGMERGDEPAPMIMRSTVSLGDSIAENGRKLLVWERILICWMLRTEVDLLTSAPKPSDAE
jgi:hypothetical protein